MNQIVRRNLTTLPQADISHKAHGIRSKAHYEHKRDTGSKKCTSPKIPDHEFNAHGEHERNTAKYTSQKKPNHLSIREQNRVNSCDSPDHGCVTHWSSRLDRCSQLDKLATGAGEMFSTTGIVAAQTSGAGEVCSMAETGAEDTVGAEDGFGLIQEVSICPPMSLVPDCTILGIVGRIQEVSNCCPACITDRRTYVEVRERCHPLELGRTSLWLPSISFL